MSKPKTQGAAKMQTTYNVREDNTYIDYTIETKVTKGAYPGRYRLSIEGQDAGWIVKDTNHGTWAIYMTREFLGYEYDAKGTYHGIKGYQMCESWDTRRDAIEFVLSRLHDQGRIEGQRVGEPEWAARYRTGPFGNNGLR